MFCVHRLTVSALDSFLCCGATVTRRTPSRQVAGNSSQAAVISKVSYIAQPLAATKTGRHTRAVPRCSARSVCRRRGPCNGCASIGPRHRKARTSAQMQQGDARRTRGWGLGRGSACDSMPATRVRRYRMRDQPSWSRTEASACSACIALLYLRWILFCAAAPQSRDAPLPGRLPEIRRRPQ